MTDKVDYSSWRLEEEAKNKVYFDNARKIAVHDALVSALKLWVDPFEGDEIMQVSDDYGVGTANKVQASREALALI